MPHYTAYLIGLLALIATQSAIASPEVTATVQLGVDHLRRQATTNDQGWFFPPFEIKRNIGWTTNIVMHREVVVERPVYEYETYEVLIPGDSPSEPPQRVQRRRIRGVRPGATERLVRYVPDPNGTFPRPILRPIYAPGDGDRWRYGGLGMNAAAIYALRQCGVAPDEPLLTIPLEALATCVETFGPPDHTVDLAWLTAAFAKMPGRRYQELTQQCASKLLDAQVPTGPAAGFWGPVAIHPPLASAYLKVVNRLGDELAELNKELTAELRQSKAEKKTKPTSKAQRLQERVNATESQLRALQPDLNRISQTAFRLYGAMGGDFRDQIQLKESGQTIRFEGLPYLIHNQVTADLESTALATFALRVAASQQRLPNQTWRPKLPKEFGQLEIPPARETRVIIQAALRAVTTARAADGTWSESNLHQPVTDFGWLKSIPAARPDTFKPLPSPVNFNSIARGAAALMNLEFIMLGPARASLAVTNDAVRTRVPDALNARPRDLGSPRGALDVLPVLARGGPAYEPWTQIAQWLVNTQNADGSWGRERRDLILPTSTVARQQATPPTTHQNIHQFLDQPHLAPPLHFKHQFQHRYSTANHTYGAVCALIFLADALPESWTPVLAPTETDSPPPTPADTPSP